METPKSNIEQLHNTIDGFSLTNSHVFRAPLLKLIRLLNLLTYQSEHIPDKQREVIK